MNNVYKEKLMADIRLSLDVLRDKINLLKNIKNNEDTDVDEEDIVQEFALLFDALMNKISILIDSLSEEEELQKAETETLKQEVINLKLELARLQEKENLKLELGSLPIRKNFFGVIMENKFLFTLVVGVSLFILTFSVVFIFYYINHHAAGSAWVTVKELFTRVKEIFIQ